MTHGIGGWRVVFDYRPDEPENPPSFHWDGPVPPPSGMPEGFWANAVVAHPEWADACPWERFGRMEWTVVLKRAPQFADRCPESALRDFSFDDWLFLLTARRDLSPRCPWNKLRQEMDENDWTNFLCTSENWHFIYRCPSAVVRKFARDCLWNEQLLDDGFEPVRYDGFEFCSDGEWSGLLRDRPDLWSEAPASARDKLDGYAWVSLVAHDPSLADRCPWERLSAGNIEELLSRHPEFADRCDLEKLKFNHVYSAWNALLQSQPSLVRLCPREEFAWLTPEAVVRALKADPSVADKVPDSFFANPWSAAVILAACPEQAGRFSGWDAIRPSDWADLVVAQPRFFDRFPKRKLQRLSGRLWARILAAQPQFADRCKWNRLEYDDWARLLSAQPQFADRCDWSELHPLTVKSILEKQPSLARFVPGKKGS